MQGSELVPALVGHGLEVAASAFIGFVGWAARASLKNIGNEVSSLKDQFGSELKSLRNEVRADLAESELRFYQRINGTYTRSEQHRDLQSRVARLERFEDERK